MFDELLKYLIFLLSFCHLLSAHYLSKQIHHDYESMKALEIKPSMLFNLNFANKIIIDINVLTSGVIAQIFNLVAELASHVGIPIK